MIAASIYAGDPRCKPNPNRRYASGQSCDALISHRNKQIKLRWHSLKGVPLVKQHVH
jgi:hypothetical protein